MKSGHKHGLRAVLIVLGLLILAHVLAVKGSRTLIRGWLSDFDATLPDADVAAAEVHVAPWRGYINLLGLYVRPGVSPSLDADPILTVGRIGVEASWPATLRNRMMTIRRLDIEDLHLRLTRLADAPWNVASLQTVPVTPEPVFSEDVAPPVAVPVDPDSLAVSVAAPVEPEPLAAVIVDRLRAGLLIALKDESRSDSQPPLALNYEAVLTVDKFRTVAVPDQDVWADLSLTGHLQGEPDRGNITLTGRLGPLVDLDRIDLDLKGRLTGLDTALLQAISGWDVTVESAVIDLILICRGGILDERQSLLSVSVQGLRMGPGWDRPLAGLYLSRATVPVALTGPLTDPGVAWDSALIDAVLRITGEGLGRKLEKLFQQ